MNRFVAFAVFCVSMLCLSGPLRAHDWNGICRDSKGRVYVVDADDGRIWRIGTDAKVELFIDAKAGEKLVHPHHLAVDADDNIWVATNCVQITKNKVFRISPDKAITETVIAFPDDFLLEMVLPDTEGGLYLIGETAILHRTKDGVLEKEKAAAIGSIAGAVALAPDGALIVGDKKVLSRVAGGKATELAQDLGDVFGVAVDAKGVVYAVDQEGGRVLAIDADKKTRVVAKGLDRPSGILTCADGTLLVKESGRSANRRPRVIRVQTDGKTSVWAECGT